MSRRGYVIDSVASAREGVRIEGEVEVAALRRLIEAAGEQKGELRFATRGEATANGGLFLHLVVEGRLRLRCQRCLEPFELDVGLTRCFRLVEAGQAWPDDELADDSFDAISAERELDLVALVEQEVLLSLPLAPRHDNCATPRHADDDHTPSPFAALSALKRRGG